MSLPKSPPTQKTIHQLKITLEDIEPKIWRYVEVPSNYNFDQLHYAVQDAMGWENCHLHKFTVKNLTTNKEETISPPSEYDDESDDYTGGRFQKINSTKAKIADYFLSKGNKALYEYDFGDSWYHEIKFEKILPAEEGVKYPRCIAGSRACPPEDCGGWPGYIELLETIEDSSSENYAEVMDWLGDDFDPEAFDASKVKFKRVR